MSRTQTTGAASILCTLLAASVALGQGPPLTPKAVLPPAEAPAGLGRVTIDPDQSFAAENAVMSNVPAAFDGLVINNFLGANRFYAEGITGQNTVASNIEAGHIWNGHVTLGHVTNFTTGAGALGETDRHATWVGMLIGGRKVPTNPRDFQTGIAIDTDLRSGAIATSWNPATPNPRYSLSFNATSTSLFSPYQSAFGGSDVINSSYVYADPTGTHPWTIGLDGMSHANPRTTFVVAAGNTGPAANTVRGAGAGYNAIAVANLANANAYDTINNGSSRGPQDYSDPLNGLVPGARVAVDIAAPGTNITSAYYGGQTGGNSPVLGGSPSGAPGDPTFFSFNVTGTSFGAPMVAGGAALLDSAARTVPALAGNPDARDSRVIKSVLLNSASKTPGWNNGQTSAGSVITTQQALDYVVGAGRMNLGVAYDQYLAGTTDVPGAAGGAVDDIGWDFGTVAPQGVNDYVIDQVLGGGMTMNVTLSWFRDRTFTDAATVSDNAYRDLDLEIWDSTFTTLIAQSQSRYENVEHLAFTLPKTGQYGVRVRYFQTLFGEAADESYGLAWAVIPEPGTLPLLAVATLLLCRRRKVSHARRFAAVAGAALAGACASGATGAARLCPPPSHVLTHDAEGATHRVGTPTTSRGIIPARTSGGIPSSSASPGLAAGSIGSLVAQQTDRRPRIFSNPSAAPTLRRMTSRDLTGEQLDGLIRVADRQLNYYVRAWQRVQANDIPLDDPLAQGINEAWQAISLWRERLERIRKSLPKPYRSAGNADDDARIARGGQAVGRAAAAGGCRSRTSPAAADTAGPGEELQRHPDGQRTAGISTRPVRGRAGALGGEPPGGPGTLPADRPQAPTMITPASPDHTGELAHRRLHILIAIPVRAGDQYWPFPVRQFHHVQLAVAADAVEAHYKPH